MVSNGAISAKLHVPFPVAARATFGFYFARFAVGDSAELFDDSESFTNFGWDYELSTTAAMASLAKGSGDIWAQKSEMHGSIRLWLIMTFMMSMSGGWSTMATNIPDFTRHSKDSRGAYWQAVFVPVLVITVAMIGIICTSCAKVIYGEYIWSPLDLAAKWTSPGGRAASFFVGFSWAVAQIGVNVSANIVSASNEMSSLYPKYINLRRGAIFTTLIGGWVMVPWKVIYSAKQNIDIPSLCRPRARYWYKGGWNLRAGVAILGSVGPDMPGMVYAVNSKVNIGGAIYIYDINFLYGFASAFLVHCASN
ncbi:uncharacterized protein PAC_13474 [Phialocephala subalpina]|uniref:Uracil permease n=1 Tax=Phialocephala subalpina TaxID=576137 RepID=A0A1L7XF49_9HELO|nr:uncharacterized protein PAC_13474 [Phialocephala subalpina]